MIGPTHPVQCPTCSRMVLLPVIDQIAGDCGACEAVHVGLYAQGHCPRCEAAIERVIEMMVTPDCAVAEE
jgi:hypothetical protein